MRTDSAPPRRTPLILLTAALLALAGCNASTPPSASGSASSSAGPSGSASSASNVSDYVTPRTMPEGKGSGAADGVFPRTVRHFQGATTLESAPKRIAVLSPGQADGLLTLGVIPAASTLTEGTDVIPAYLYTAYPQLKDGLDAVVRVGTPAAPSVEALANLEPALILVDNTVTDPEKLYRNLSLVAPTVFTQGSGPHWKQDFLLAADALGKTTAASDWLDSYQSEAQAFGRSVTDKPEISLVYKAADRIQLFGAASPAGSVVEDLGLPRPVSQRFTNSVSIDLTAEQLAQADAGWIFYAVQGGDEAELTGLAQWPALAAVKAQRAVEVDGATFFVNTEPTAAQQVLEKFQTTLD